MSDAPVTVARSEYLFIVEEALDALSSEAAYSDEYLAHKHCVWERYLKICRMAHTAIQSVRYEFERGCAWAAIDANKYYTDKERKELEKEYPRP